ncbi:MULTISPECIES: hypothetical protein [unclassified Microbacterium]|uniref:hypothetical protein n=1 Tax=unclassified Microbacterium TaxID=2609290 RepID=UPI0014029B42|nr:hypothetical protein [Microbacterium sp. Gd 4-13]
MTDANRTEDAGPEGSELISRLRIIEGQPLGDRAAAYASLHDELARRLESGPTDHHVSG